MKMIRVRLSAIRDVGYDQTMRKSIFQICEKQLWFNCLQDNVELIKKAQNYNQIGLEALLPYILDKAFNGELV